MATQKYKYAEKNKKLLLFHMNCNPDYLFGHAKVAGKLANREFTSYEEYKSTCGRQGINYYNEEIFNDFMELNTEN